MNIIWTILTAFVAPLMPAVDDGPCPIDQPTVVYGDDYQPSGFWVHADGTVFGYSHNEDTCIVTLVAS